MVRRNLRIPDKLNDALEKEAKRLGIPSLNEATVEAVRHFLVCKKTEGSPALKHIPLKYPGKCQCGKKLDAGEWAWWGKDLEGSIIICNDCQIQKHGDKATIRKLLKNKELQYAKSVLEKEIDRLLDQYRDFNFFEIVDKIHKAIMKRWTVRQEYYEKVATPEEKKLLEKTMDTDKKVLEFLEEAKQFMKQPWKKKKKKTVGLV